MIIIICIAVCIFILIPVLVLTFLRTATRPQLMALGMTMEDWRTLMEAHDRTVLARRPLVEANDARWGGRWAR